MNIEMDFGHRRDFEYTPDELNDLEISLLNQIARDYNLNINKLSKSKIISKILNYQDKISVKKFDLLPNDILRLIGEHLDICSLVRFCRISRKLQQSICQNDRFLKNLGHRYLTEHDNRLPETNKILKNIYADRDLSVVVREGYEKRMIYMNKHGANIDANYEYLLRQAAARGYLDIIKYLISKSNTIHSKDIYSDALVQAALNGHLNVVKYFTEENYPRADINYKDDWALRIAADDGYLNVVEYLVEHGADIHAVDDYALRWAAANGHLPIVKYLVEHGADIHVDNDWALKNAEQYNHSDVVKYLISQGPLEARGRPRADINVLTKTTTKVIRKSKPKSR